MYFIINDFSLFLGIFLELTYTFSDITIWSDVLIISKTKS